MHVFATSSFLTKISWSLRIWFGVMTCLVPKLFVRVVTWSYDLDPEETLL